jgi:hypothetical protein
VLATLHGGPVAPQEVTGVVQQPRVVERHHLRRHGRDRRIRLERRQGAFEPVGREHDVGVDERDRLGLHLGDPAVRGGAEAEVGAERHHARRRRVLGEDRER